MAIVKKRLKLEQSLYTILQILSITLFEKKPVAHVFADDENVLSKISPGNQLKLFS